MSEPNQTPTYDTLDGGPPSTDKIGLELNLFLPFTVAKQILTDDKNVDQHAASSLFHISRAMYQRPGPLCSTCDHEFEFGAMPALAYYLVPAFPKATNYKLISGVICNECALRCPTPEQLRDKIFKCIQLVKPDAEMVSIQ